MSRVNPPWSPNQPEPQAGDLALHSGVGRGEAPPFHTASRIANSLIALATSLKGDPRVTFWQLPTRVVIGSGSLYCAICLRCHTVIGLADSATDAALSFCRVCDEIDTARVRGRHVLARLVALRHGLSIDDSSTDNATAKS